MKCRNLLLAVTATLLLSAQAFAGAPKSNAMDEFDPSSPDAERILEDMDAEYERATGKSPFLETPSLSLKSMFGIQDCKRTECAVFLDINKSTQKADLYENGVVTRTFKISSGKQGHSTPNYNGHPTGRIYDAHQSSRYPGGEVYIDGKNMGNMPYAVFFKTLYAVHGTLSVSKLGTRASHGCVRMHTDNARIFNRLVRANGIANVYMSVHD